MPVPGITLAPRPLLRDEVYERLRDAIVDGTLAPDEQLRDTDLATWLGVSRTPVREALLELGRNGLVRSLPGRSTVVAPLDAAGVRDAQTVVAAMHRLAIEGAIPRLTAADLDRMVDANARFDTAQSKGDADAALAADQEFHAVAIDVCGNAAVRAVIAQYEPVLHRAERLRFGSQEGRASVHRHDRLIELCRAGDVAGAAALAEQTWRSLSVDTDPTPAGGPAMKLAEFDRYPLTFGPSPLQHLKRLTQHLGGAEVWAKREDVSSGLAYGGNKIRKLEYIVPDVLASGADTLVSIGGYQSNHTRQVAAVAAHLGLKCRLVQEKWVPWDDPTNDRVGNILLSRMMGADSRLDDAGFDIGVRDSWKIALQEVEASGGKPYAIPAGASEHPLGGLGFANWAFEVAEQEKALGITFETIIVCTVTGSTHAGMIAGFAALEDLTGVRRRVLGIDASATLAKTTAQVARIARNTAELIELGRELRDDEIQVLEGWAGDLYGIPVDSTMEAMELGAQLEAMITDPVYEGKSLAGLIDLVREGDIPADSHVLYAHLGGQPAINAYHRLWA